MSYIDTRAQLRRDPFARTTLFRELVAETACAWCGGRGRFSYYWESDGDLHGRARFFHFRDGGGRAYCRIGCWEADWR